MSDTALMTRETLSPEVPAPPERELNGVLAEFESAEALLDASRKVRDAGFSKWDTHSPYPVHGIDAAMGTKPTVLPLVIFACGLTGAAVGTWLQLYANGVWYPLVISGKPYFSLPANIPIMFELTILFSALGAVFGMLIFNGLPALYNALFHSQRFARVTRDRFFVSIQAADPKFDEIRTSAFLQSLGSTHVESVHDVGTPNPPRVFFVAGAIMAVVALIPLAIIWRARVDKSPEPRVHIIQDMDNQERFKSQQANTLFADGRAMRPPVSGTVARGDLRIDSHFFRGMVNNTFVTTFPAALRLPDGRPVKTAADFGQLIERGEQRFAIYCAPCHGLDGSGTGPVAVRARELAEPTWVAPLDLASDEPRGRALGHLFNTITNGIRNMPPYGDQIPEADRWAIIAYVRALQRARHTTIDDVPAEHREALNR